MPGVSKLFEVFGKEVYAPFRESTGTKIHSQMGEVDGCHYEWLDLREQEDASTHGFIGRTHAEPSRLMGSHVANKIENLPRC